MRAFLNYLQLPGVAKKEHRKDRAGLANEDPGIKMALEESVAWLCRAQDNSASQEGDCSSRLSSGIKEIQGKGIPAEKELQQGTY